MKRLYAFAMARLLLSLWLLCLFRINCANEPSLDGMIRIKSKKQLYDRGMAPWPTTPVNALCLMQMLAEGWQKNGSSWKIQASPYKYQPYAKGMSTIRAFADKHKLPRKLHKSSFLFFVSIAFHSLYYITMTPHCTHQTPSFSIHSSCTFCVN